MKDRIIFLISELINIFKHGLGQPHRKRHEENNVGVLRGQIEIAGKGEFRGGVQRLPAVHQPNNRSKVRGEESAGQVPRLRSRNHRDARPGPNQAPEHHGLLWPPGQ